jgi:alpha-tubulin suppressor-like RCC1 family protein
MPTKVLGLEPSSHVAAGNTFTCARTLAGDVRCWGANGSGQLGDGLPLYGASAHLARIYCN